MRGYFRLTHAGTCVLPARAEAPPPPSQVLSMPQICKPPTILRWDFQRKPRGTISLAVTGPQCLSAHLALCPLQAQVSLNLRLAQLPSPVLDRCLFSPGCCGVLTPPCVLRPALSLPKACWDFSLAQPCSCLAGPSPSSDLLPPLPGCGR